jgi:hypothetical protein
MFFLFSKRRGRLEVYQPAAIFHGSVGDQSAKWRASTAYPTTPAPIIIPDLL